MCLLSNEDADSSVKSNKVEDVTVESDVAQGAHSHKEALLSLPGT